MTTINSIIFEIINEIIIAEEKFPAWPNDIIHASAIVAEESGELVRAALQCEYEGGSIEAAKTEAIQTAAMAVRFLKNISEYKLFPKIGVNRLKIRQ